jgi:hypothetical protein
MGERGRPNSSHPRFFHDRSPGVPPFSLLAPFLGLKEAAMLLGLQQGVRQRDL